MDPTLPLQTRLAAYFTAVRSAWVPGMSCKGLDPRDFWRFVGDDLFVCETLGYSVYPWSEQAQPGLKLCLEALARGPAMADPATAGAMLMSVPFLQVTQDTEEGPEWWYAATQARGDEAQGTLLGEGPSREDAIAEAFMNWKGLV